MMVDDRHEGEAGATVLENGNKVLTIGHSTLPIETFLARLETADVSAVADVRSSPFSGRAPHFSRDELRPTLKARGIKYVFLGTELGGRPHDRSLYCDGVADYEKMALESDFLEGIGRVISGAREHTIALMCSEHNPLDCHRCLLVGRILVERNVSVGHILNNGRIAEQKEIEEKLLNLSVGATYDMFATREDSLSKAYRLRAKKVAYREPKLGMAQPTASDWHEHAL